MDVLPVALSVLYDVPVALVCTNGEGATPPVIWDSNDALAKYHALPPEAAPAHTHSTYVDTELGNTLTVSRLGLQ
jgi:hypothetical protein